MFRHDNYFFTRLLYSHHWSIYHKHIKVSQFWRFLERFVRYNLYQKIRQYRNKWQKNDGICNIKNSMNRRNSCLNIWECNVAISTDHGVWIYTQDFSD